MFLNFFTKKMVLKSYKTDMITSFKMRSIFIQKWATFNFSKKKAKIQIILVRSRSTIYISLKLSYTKNHSSSFFFLNNVIFTELNHLDKSLWQKKKKKKKTVSIQQQCYKLSIIKAKKKTFLDIIILQAVYRNIWYNYI